MNCAKIKDKLIFFIASELEEKETDLIKEHLVSCINCKKEYELTLKLNKLAINLPEIEPRLDFDQRFWIKFDRMLAEENQTLSLFNKIWAWIIHPKMVPAYVLSLIFIVMLTLLPRYFIKHNSLDMQLASNLELLDNFEVIENLDLMSNFDVILNLAQLEEE